MKVREVLGKFLNLVPSWGCWLERNFVALELIDKKRKFILEIGCGKYGGLFAILNKSGSKIISMDIRKDIERDVLRNSKFTYVIASAERIPFKRFTFDQVICLDILEHVKNDKLAAKEINRVLKRNGKLILTVPSNFWRFPYYNFMKFFSPTEEEILKLFGHFRKGYSIRHIQSFPKSEKRGSKVFYK